MGRIELDFGLHPRQLQAFNSPATELLFGGATEGGKSHFLRVLLSTYCLEVPGLQCTLIRKKYADILANHVEGRTGFKALLNPLLTRGAATITSDMIRFANGSNIFFQHCQDERQFDSAQGVERQILAIDEATQISERLIRFFRTWVRMPKEMKDTLPEQYRDKLPMIIYTANPIGPSVPFFRRHFVDARQHESIELVEGFKRQYMRSRYTDNPSVDVVAHQGRLAGIGDDRLAEALDSGNWGVLVGEFFPEWNEDRHVVADFIPPHWWYRYRTMDIGWSEPCAIYWVAISDGEPFRDELGRERWFPRGAKIFYREWYIYDEQAPQKGLNFSNEDIARGILERSDAQNLVTLVDSKPFQETGESPAQKFRACGVPLTMVPCGPNTRVPGWSMVRDALIGVEAYGLGTEKVPMAYWCESCRFARDYMPALPRHPSESRKEDAAESGEATHSPDAIRYGHLVHSVVKDCPLPMESQIKKAIAASKPTVQKLLAGTGINLR